MYAINVFSAQIKIYKIHRCHSLQRKHYTRSVCKVVCKASTYIRHQHQLTQPRHTRNDFNVLFIETYANLCLSSCFVVVYRCVTRNKIIIQCIFQSFCGEYGESMAGEHAKPTEMRKVEKTWRMMVDCCWLQQSKCLSQCNKKNHHSDRAK